MAKERELWRTAASDAGLTAGERDRLDRALEHDDGLGTELSYLLQHLSADLSGAFLREFVDRLRSADDVDAAAVFVLPALERTIAPSAWRRLEECDG